MSEPPGPGIGVDDRWRPDAELEGFECLDLPLTAEPLPDETVEQLTATLVRRVLPEGEGRPDRAVLYVHGWNDYFFQRHLADFWRDLGFDFHAIDLRRYGRSLRPGMKAGYVADMSEHFEELDAAVAVIRRDHEQVTLMAHSTGGLVAVLYAHERPGTLSGLVLNSPWLALHGTATFQRVAQAAYAQLGSRRPTGSLRVPDNGFYRRTIDAELGGEWHYNHELKGDSGFALWNGWMRAIVAGHARVAAGLSIQEPVLVAVSSRSSFARRWDAEVMAASDIVLDVKRLASASLSLGSCVTLVRIDGGVHDLTLSAAPVREHFFAEITRWCRAYQPASAQS